jgi:regulatory protein
LRLLDQRARTRSELATALAKKGVPAEAAQVVLDRFADLGLIDDAAFAANFAAARHQQRRLAPRAITTQLRRRGVADADIEHAVAGIDDDSERRAARELVDAKLRRFDAGDAAGTTRRLVAMLARRGYSSGVAFTTVREALAERGAEISPLETDF